MFEKRMLPPTCLLIAVVLMVVLGYFLPVAHLIPRWWNLVGVVPIILGIILDLLADRFFRQVHATVKQGGKPAVLAVGGVYAISRNPMYLGFELILVGIAVLLGSVSPWAVVAGFGFLVQRAYICNEERVLARKFGDLWKGYCKHTPRWI